MTHSLARKTAWTAVLMAFSLPGMMPVRFREAGPEDAEQVAMVHATSWRRFYRGAYSDSYLDGDVVADRHSVWTARLRAKANTVTILAEDAAGLAGFIHVVIDDDDHWGSLVDNLHVLPDRQRGGIGKTLLTRAADDVVQRAATKAMYLWVLEQNIAAQRFYQAVGGIRGETVEVDPPGGVPGRLNGTPSKLRIVWPDAAVFQTLQK